MLIICNCKLVLWVLVKVVLNVVIKLWGRWWIKLIVLVKIMGLILLIFNLCRVGFSVVNNWLVVYILELVIWLNNVDLFVLV